MANDLTVHGNNAQVGNLINDLFKNIDFTGLNSTIEALADHNGDLSDGEKKLAVQVIGEWELNVIDQLQFHNKEMTELVSFFEDGSSVYYYKAQFSDKVEEIGYDLAVRTNTVLEFQTLKNALQAVKNLQHERPFQPIIDENTRYGEQIGAQKKYEAEMQRYNIREQKLEREAYQKELVWRRLLLQHPDIQGMIKKAKTYTRDLTKFTNQCKGKAQFAKLNVSIQSMEIRTALKELLSFSIL